MIAATVINPIALEATGALEAQRVVEALRAETLASDHIWLAFVVLAVRHGWKSAACRAFVAELAKRAR